MRAANRAGNDVSGAYTQLELRALFYHTIALRSLTTRHQFIMLHSCYCCAQPRLTRRCLQEEEEESSNLAESGAEGRRGGRMKRGFRASGVFASFANRAGNDVS